jgi:hypothetical protein
LERIAVGVMFGAAVLPSMRAPPNHRHAVLARTGGTILPGWIGFGGLALVQLCWRQSPACGQGSEDRERLDPTVS